LLASVISPYVGKFADEKRIADCDRVVKQIRCLVGKFADK